MAPGGLAGLRRVSHYEEEWLVAVGFHFEDGILLVEVDPEYDDVAITLTPTGPVTLAYWPDARCVDATRASLYAGLAGAGSIWRWALRNQQGYTDAFQIELVTETVTTTLQYLAIASRLEVRTVDETPGTA
jgi:hypothetical protein